MKRGGVLDEERRKRREKEMILSSVTDPVSISKVPDPWMDLILESRIRIRILVCL